MNRLAPVRQAFPEERDLRALVDFANIDDPEAIPKFRRQHSGFEPFELAGTSAMDFPSAVLAYCELLRQLWRG